MNKNILIGITSALSCVALGIAVTNIAACIKNKSKGTQHQSDINHSEDTKITNIKSQTSLSSYLKEAKISQAQEEAFKVTNKTASEIKGDDNVAKLSDISSNRSNESRTALEKDLDSAVESGDLPIIPFTFGQIDLESKLNKSKKDSSKSPNFVLKGGVDALDLHKQFKGINVVQVASQFNALESTSAEISPVKDWIEDPTQGPRASLQSVCAAKHREAASLQKKLPDALQELLDKCSLEDERKILEKYKNVKINNIKKRQDLYKNGYLQLFLIEDENDLKTLRDFLNKNIGDVKFLSQWVKCERTGSKQLQVFNAGPSFQFPCPEPDWNKTDNRTKLLKEICEIIVSNEYKAIAQVAAIMSKQTDTPISLHLTLVGQGAFRNPPEVIKSAIKKVKEELEGTNVNVFLHGHYSSDCQKWKDASEKTIDNLVYDQNDKN